MDFIVDFLIVAVFALCIFVGVKNGLIRSIIGLVVVAAAAALAVWLSEPVASGIYDLFIKKSLETAVAAQLPDMSSAQLTSQNVQEVISSLPAAIVKAAQSMGVDIVAISEKTGSVDLSASNIAAEICDSVAKPIAVAVLKVLSFAVIFFVCDFFLQIAAKAVCKLFELPVIRSVNRTLGGVFGALKGRVRRRVCLPAARCRRVLCARHAVRLGSRCIQTREFDRFNRYIFAADNGLIFPSPHREEHI